MEIKENFNIQKLNTFGIKVDAKYFVEVASVVELQETLEYANHLKLPLLVLGGGSNLLFTKNFPGFVIKINLRGIDLLKEDNEHFYVKAYAGENWDEFVDDCCNRGYYGLENLSLIPGNVGASPIQNIGAYGVELKDHFSELEFYDFASRQVKTISKTACDFGYRNSIFKNELKNKGVVLSVAFQLNKSPVLKTEYGAIHDELDRMGVNHCTSLDIRKAVINIRRSKLPDPEELGNAGSFFKNPVVPIQKYEALLKQFQGLVTFNQIDGSYKLAAGWLIDQCGWKGYRKGDAGVHKKQALVLVNYGNAKGTEILSLANDVSASVFSKFGVSLVKEVNII